MLTGVIFDMDGVIIDSEDLHKETELALLHDHGVDITREEFIKHTGRPLNEIITSINEEYGADIDHEAFLTERRRQYRARMDEIPLIDGQDELITDLAERYPVAVATAEVRDIAEDLLEQKGISPHIRTLVTSSDITHGKPHPEVFETAARELGVEPATTAVIEDSHNGITAANRGGFISIGFRTAAGHDSIDLSEADHVVTSSAELRELLTELGDA